MASTLCPELLSDLLTRALERDPKYPKALAIAQRFGRGDLVLHGGAVYRPLVRELYGVPCADHDYDFLVDWCESPVSSPSHICSTTDRGNPRFLPTVTGEPNVDLIPLRAVGASIDSFIDAATFTVQAIGYRIKDRRVIGDIGIRALSDRIVAVNNRSRVMMVGWSAEMLTLQLHRKALSLGFLLSDPSVTGGIIKPVPQEARSPVPSGHDSFYDFGGSPY